MRNTGFEIRSSEIEALNKKFNSLSQKVNKAAGDGLNKVGMKILADAQGNLKKNNSIATGKLINSGKVVDARGSFDVEVGFDTDYAYFVEFGRKAGTPPPWRPIFEWVKKKHIADTFSIKTRRPTARQHDFETKAKSLAFAIAKSKERKGTKARPFLYPAFRKNEDEVIKILQDAINRVV